MFSDEEEYGVLIYERKYFWFFLVVLLNWYLEIICIDDVELIDEIVM